MIHSIQSNALPAAGTVAVEFLPDRGILPLDYNFEPPVSENGNPGYLLQPVSMLPFFSFFPLAQITPSQPSQTPPPPIEITVPISEDAPSQPVDLQPPKPQQPREVVDSHEVRPLPGRLDNVPVFNSNSPEIVRTEGILVSTFPGQGKRSPSAHLNFPFRGRFDIFAHHIARAKTPEEARTLFFGILVHNPSNQPVTVRVLQSATYLAKPHAPYIKLPDYQDDPHGTVYAGPGSRIVNDVLRGRRQGSFPSSLSIPPRQSRMLLNLPIPVGKRVPSSNTRSTLARLSSNGPVYVASLAMFAPLDFIEVETKAPEPADGNESMDGTKEIKTIERPPTLREWQELLVRGNLAGPRDRRPTPPDAPLNRFFPNWYLYGRVAGVARGSQWNGKATDGPTVDHLTIPQPGQAFSYGVSTLPRGTLGTGQVQSAEMLARYPDTAYQAHGNYGIQYSLELPLYNPSNQSRRVSIVLQTPVKEDQPRDGLRFLVPPENRVFYRGTIRIRYTDAYNATRKRYVHVVQKRGQQGKPLVEIDLRPRDRKLVEVDFLYPPDSTPPQILTIRTNDNGFSTSSTQTINE